MMLRKLLLHYRVINIVSPPYHYQEMMHTHAYAGLILEAVDDNPGHHTPVSTTNAPHGC